MFFGKKLMLIYCRKTIRFGFKTWLSHFRTNAGKFMILLNHSHVHEELTVSMKMRPLYEPTP